MNHSTNSMCLINQCRMFRLEGSGHSLILTMRRRGDKHFLNPEFIESFKKYLSVVHVKSKASPGSVLVTTAEGSTFCAGFDFRYAQNQADAGGSKDEAYEKMYDGFKDVVKDLISLPMPTIAAINGNAAEAGLMLALSHDHLTMKQASPYLSALLLSKGRRYPGYFAALIRSKVGCPLARRKLLLREEQINTKEAARIGLLNLNEVRNGKDALEEAKTRAEELAEKGWDGEVYAKIRKALYPELFKALYPEQFKELELA